MPMYHLHAGAYGGQKRADALKLQVQVAVWADMRVLETAPVFSGRATSVFNQWAISILFSDKKFK